MTDERCADCRFWDHHESTDQGGCRRHPPVLNVPLLAFEAREKARPGLSSESDEASDRTFHTYNWAFPVTQEDEWCGEFRPKPPGPTP